MRELRRILLVDDSAADVKLMMAALRDAGLANPIDTCRDGAEALDFLFHRGPHAQRTDPTCPCVMLLDLKMPKMDGLEVLAKIRQDDRLKTLPVVIITSSAEEKDIITSYNLGVNAYVVKPVTHGQFLAAIKNVGLFWAVVNRPSPGL